MEEDNNVCTKGEKIRGEEDKCENESVVKRPSVLLKDDAGPSRVNDLPGAISHISNNTFSIKSGVSKSEHCIRQIVTNKDVPQGIQLTSLSFGSPKQTKNIEINEIKIPILNSLYNEKEGDPATLVELKKFMASCFKFNKDGCNALNEVANTVQPNNGTIANELIHNIPNASSFTNKGFINEVAVTNPNALNGTQLKSVPSNKKKSSGILSEKSEIGIAQRDSLSSIGSNVCRICMTKGRERLISPCNCKGSLANVHLTCLERWLNQVGRNHCELCGFSYPAIRTPRYTILQALRLWFGNPRNRSHLQSDCLIFWLLSTVTAGLLAVCIVGTQYFVIEGNNFGKLDPARKNEGILHAGGDQNPLDTPTYTPGMELRLHTLQLGLEKNYKCISHRITETAMDFFMAIVLCGYSVTVYLLWKDHFVMWNRWRRANVNVRLLLSPDSNPVPFTPRHRYNIV